MNEQNNNINQQPMMQQPMQQQPVMNQAAPQPRFDPYTGQPLQPQQGKKLKTKGNVVLSCLGALINIVVFFFAIDLFIISPILTGLAENLGLYTSELLLDNHQKYASNLSLFFIVVFALRYGANAIIGWLSTRNSFRKKYLTKASQIIYIIFSSIVLNAINIWIIIRHRTLIGELLNEIKSFRTNEYIKPIIAKCESMQTFNIVIGIIGIVLSTFFVYHVTKKRNAFVTE